MDKFVNSMVSESMWAVIGCVVGGIFWFFVARKRIKLPEVAEYPPVPLPEDLLISLNLANGSVPVGRPAEEQTNNCSSPLSAWTKVRVFYASQTGSSEKFASQFASKCQILGKSAAVVDLKNYDPEESLQTERAPDSLCIFFLSTHEEGRPSDSGRWFCQWLEEAVSDFRVDKAHLSGLNFAVVGLGNSLYVENYNKVAKNVDNWLAQLSANRVHPLTLLDENVVNSKHGSQEGDFLAWTEALLSLSAGDSCGSNCECAASSKRQCQQDKAADSPPEPDSDNDNNEENGTADGNGAELLMDVEDLGEMMLKAKVNSAAGDGTNSGELRDMITPQLRASLEKQGYRLVGSHSGVKMCRWTKSMLRGRGGCYKHSFYGIASHLCMEATPSLACANKCVFCWRHHTNPVGTEWRWRQDPPEMIVEQAVANHANMIKQFKGVPGVDLDRWTEALTPRHCALSLVGEPIMYPEINTLIDLLHSRRISTFLVTNAQFPEPMRTLRPVTQLYVSVDAGTREALKRIDRPLFPDFWERFLASLAAMKLKQQRTVYRLTLVKAWNTDELDNYARLVRLGDPDFVEVKGVTYCGESKASKLTMENVPWHEEVTSFVQQLTDRLQPDYAIAAEHEHSNCLLIAHTKFRINGSWHTWIDYDRFHDLIASGRVDFTSLEYAAPTPLWAVFGAQERGFDPDETRVVRQRRHGNAANQFREEASCD